MRGWSNLLYVVILLATNFPAVAVEFSRPDLDICADLKQVAPGDYRDAQGHGSLLVNGFVLFPLLQESPVQIRKEPLAGGGEFTGLYAEATVFVGRVENGHQVEFDKTMLEYVSLTKSGTRGLTYWTEVNGVSETVRNYHFNNEPVSQIQYFGFNADANKNISLLSFGGEKTLIGKVCFHRIGVSQQIFDVQNPPRPTGR